MKFMVLIENSAAENFQCEHGLSILIEHNGEQFLLDAGTTDLFLENAKMLNAPIWDAKECFLSHGHYDHSGGFGTYLKQNHRARLHMMKDAVKEYYSCSGEIHPIGVPETVLKEHSDRFQFVDKVTKVRDDIYLIPHDTEGLEVIGQRAGLCRKVGENLIPDNFSHEMSVVFRTEKGLVIFNSCSHGGAKNIIEEVNRALPGEKVYVFVGGLHMKGKKDGQEICTFSEDEIAELTSELERLGLEILYTGHCTGKPAMELLEKYMGEKLKALYSGLVVEL